MRLRDMTMEELEELEQTLHDQEEEGNYSLYSQKIAVYEEMHHKLKKRAQEKNEDQSYLEYVTKKLVFYLIHYGTYLKMQYEKDETAAVRCLKKALTYDRRNPIAAYRLGFLSYKRKDYTKALIYFQEAINHQNRYEEARYQLNETQLVHAHLYLTNSALHIAKHTYERMDELPRNSRQELPNYQFSTLYESLAKNERYLEKHAFYKISQEEKTTCAKEECEELMTHEPENTIVLYFNDRTINLLFNEDQANISQERGDILRYLLLNTSKDSPATRNTLKNFFLQLNAREEVNIENFRQKIRRIRHDMRECRIPDVIQTTNYAGETAYYFDQSLPYIVMYRVDEEMGGGIKRL
ncbi:tetratricopeptide repeat protein [Bacillus sp. B190/17]|uniref:Tetratricopeptide repeat protein n=1 Tax=Bacillus lumedeiriae TaxID=3058829 RepID=A0ABW8I9D5_9BACI